MEQALLEFVSKTLNIDKDGVAELIKSDDGKIKDDALNVLLEKDKERVKGIKKTSFDDGVKKTTKSLMSDFEKQLKDKYELDSDAQGIELIESLLEKQKPVDEDKSKSKKDITWEDIKKRPDFIEYEKKIKKEQEDKYKEFEDKLKATESEYKKKETRSVIEKDIIDYIDNELKPSFSSNPTIAANQKRVLVEEILKLNPDKQGNQILFVKEDGSRLEDEHGHLVDFKSKVKEITGSYFDIPVADNRSSAGNDNNKDKDKDAKKPLQAPKTKDEYVQILSDTTIPLAERQKYKEEFSGKI